MALERSRRKARGLTCSSSCLSLCSCDSSCLLWSSSICILASRRPLCWRSSLASAMSSASRGLCGETGTISGGDGSGDSPLWSCCCFKRSYSACKFLLRSNVEVKALRSWTGLCRLPSERDDEKAPPLVRCDVMMWCDVPCRAQLLGGRGSPASPAFRSAESTCLQGLRLTDLHGAGAKRLSASPEFTVDPPPRHRTPRAGWAPGTPRSPGTGCPGLSPASPSSTLPVLAELGLPVRFHAQIHSSSN